MHGVLKGLCGIFLTVPLLSSPVSSAPPEPDSPKIIRSKADRPASPVWTSAEAVAMPGGAINWSLLGDRAHMIYESVLRNTPRLVVESPGEEPKYDPDSSGMRPECVYYGAAHFDYPNSPTEKTLDDVFKNAQAVLRGRVVEMTPGFYLGEPNTLLTVSLEKSIRRSKAFAKGSTFYVVYPKARFAIGDITFCKTDTKFPYAPKVGDRVLLLPLHGPQGREARLIQPGPGELIFEK